MLAGGQATRSRVHFTLFPGNPPSPVLVYRQVGESIASDAEKLAKPFAL